MPGFLQRIKHLFHNEGGQEPLVIARHHHKVSRKLISQNALKVLYRLNKSGYAAYLVGGGVRDLLLKKNPKDFDIATDAYPEDVSKIFRNSRMIGRRFRIVHVYFYDEIIEVSTFRSNAQDNPKLSQQADDDEPPVAMIKSDNNYGTIEEDAWRRDFTVNALYYNIEDFSVIDYTGGMADLKKRQLRMIGDPVQRYHEDPVRLLRAIRLSAKLNFKIEKATEKPLTELAGLLQHVSSSRLFDELLKMLFKGHAQLTYTQLAKYGYIEMLFPQTAQALQLRQNQQDDQLIQLALRATDTRYANEQSLNPGFLLAVLLWPAIQQRLTVEHGQHERFYQELHASIECVLREQSETLNIPKRLKTMMRSVWVLQYHLLNRRRKRIFRTLSHRYFRAAYDFLELRVKSGESFVSEYQWWKRFQSAKPAERQNMLNKLNYKSTKKSTRRS